MVWLQEADYTRNTISLLQHYPCNLTTAMDTNWCRAHHANSSPHYDAGTHRSRLETISFIRPGAQCRVAVTSCLPPFPSRDRCQRRQSANVAVWHEVSHCRYQTMRHLESLHNALRHQHFSGLMFCFETTSVRGIGVLQSDVISNILPVSLHTGVIISPTH